MNSDSISKGRKRFAFSYYFWNRVPKVCSVVHKAILRLICAWFWQAKITRNVPKVIIRFLTLIGKYIGEWFSFCFGFFRFYLEWLPAQSSRMIYVTANTQNNSSCSILQFLESFWYVPYFTAVVKVRTIALWFKISVSWSTRFTRDFCC